jgi:hypothetical protein
MKYLKEYKIFEAKKLPSLDREEDIDLTPLEEDIYDICTELFDLHWSIVISDYGFIIHAQQPKEKYKLQWEDVKDCVLRLNDFLGNKIKIFHFVTSNNLNAYTLRFDTVTIKREKLTEDFKINQPIIGIRVWYIDEDELYNLLKYPKSNTISTGSKWKMISKKKLIKIKPYSKTPTKIMLDMPMKKTILNEC